MTTVETVRGPVEATELGPTLAHEHVFVMQPEALQNYGHVWGPSYWDEDVRVADAVDKLRAVRAAGIRTIIDPTARASDATSRGYSGSTRRSTSTSSSQPASTRSSSSPTSSTTAAPKRSPSSSSGRSARESTTPA